MVCCVQGGLICVVHTIAVHFTLTMVAILAMAVGIKHYSSNSDYISLYYDTLEFTNSYTVQTLNNIHD